jgi:hypothetical protein
MGLLLHPADLLGGPGGLLLLFVLFVGTGILGIGFILLFIRIAKWNGDRINRKRSRGDGDM